MLQTIMFLFGCRKASASIGFCISLGHTFFSEGGMTEVSRDITPMLLEHTSDVSPRVVPGYAMLYWYAEKVHVYCCVHNHALVSLVVSQLLEAVKMSEMIPALKKYFYNKVLITASKLQSKTTVSTEPTGPSAVATLDPQGEAILDFIQAKSKVQVHDTGQFSYSEQHIPFVHRLQLSFGLTSSMQTKMPMHWLSVEFQP